MTGRRSRRSTTRVDYSKFERDEEGKELVKQLGTNDDDDDEEFQLKEGEDKDPVSDEDPMDVDIIEEDEEVVSTPKRQSSVTAAKKSTVKKTRTPARVSAKPTTDSPKSTSRRNGSLMERMSTILGANTRVQAEAISARGVWGNSMFIPQKCDMGKFMLAPDIEPEEIPLDPQVLEELREVDLEKYLFPERSVVVNEETLKSFTDIAGKEQNIFNGTILNAGGFVTSISWAPGYHGYEQYLAVGVLDDDHRDPMNCQVNKLEISLFSRKGFPSSIYIYRVNLDPEAADQSICELIMTISHDFGSAVNLKWRPGGTKLENIIGTLAMVNQDGLLRVLQIPRVSILTRYRIVNPLRCFEAPGYGITCFCWRTENNVTVGTDNGSIAEFDISDTSDYGSEPSFMVSVAASYIATISSGFPNEPHLIFEFSTDGMGCTIDVRNIRSRLYSLRMKSSSSVSAYIPWSSSFVSTDDIFTVKVQPIRDFRAQGTTNSINTHSVPVTAIGVSYFHPFVLTGSMDGIVKIGNSVRRLLAPKRTLASTYLSATLWGLDFSMLEKAYRISSIYKTDKLGKGEAIELLQPYPSNSFVTSIEWSQALETAEWYAAGTSSGLIKIHRLVDGQTTV